MKKIARWTIGPVSSIGFDILLESLRFFSKIYPEIERVICFNNIDPSLLKMASKFADVLEQKGEDVGCLLTPPDANVEEASGCGWKLSPPRIDIESHELFIDNDVVIRERLPQIDEWLTSSKGIISQGQGRKRMYGRFDSFISKEIHVCAGVFGLPPYFNFFEMINQKIQFLNGVTLGGFDEQGLTSSIIVNMSDYLLIPNTSLVISEDHVGFPQIMPSAIHFVGANRKPWHRGWKAYKSFEKFRPML